MEKVGNPESQPMPDSIGPLIGQSRAFALACELLHKAAVTQVSVLLTGETGVGKERFARKLHAMSTRRDKPFVAVNCAALPNELIESELFGSEKGAYTGAVNARPGRFERACGGTLFLDELGELPLSAQAKLLRVLQDGVVERLGATQGKRVDVRLVAATNSNLAQAVSRGHFRQDLYYRLNVYPIRLPPLRERIDDIEPLAHHLLARFTTLHNKPLPGFTDPALQAMRQYAWPGNVRELENLIERGVILSAAEQRIDVEQLFPLSTPEELRDNESHEKKVAPEADDLLGELVHLVLERGLHLEKLEAAIIREAVARKDGNLSAAARLLGLSRPQLSYRFTQLAVQEK